MGASNEGRLSEASADAAVSLALSALVQNLALAKIIELMEKRPTPEETAFEWERIAEKLDTIGEPLQTIAGAVDGIERNTRK